MAKESIKPNEIAQFAAEGVALAMKGREAAWRGPIHIIVGVPQEVFNVTLDRDEHDTLRVSLSDRQPPNS